jgi:hypothetical protein
LALNAKGGEIKRPKQKDRTTTQFLKPFNLPNLYYCFLQKTLLAAKRRKTIYAKGEKLFRGSFYVAKGKAFENGGSLSNLKMLFENSILTP